MSLIMNEVLKVENLLKYYGTRGNITKAVNNISFHINEGEFIAIMGPSGSGKSTLLNCISTIDNVTSGHIFVKHKDITKFNRKDLSKFRREDLGFIFQDFNLLDTLTIFENIALALTISKVPAKEIKTKVYETAEKLDIKEILNKFPSEVSGGQKQRTAAARAIVTNPNIILADEPTGALDSKSSRMLLESLEKLNKQYKASILMVTHDAFAASFAHRILFIKDGEVFNEIVKGNLSRKDFFNKIIQVVTLLGGDMSDVF